MKKLRTRKRRVVLSRSAGGDFGVTIFMILLGILMFFPMYYLIIQSLKPLDELFYFPPRLIVSNPSFENFSDLFNLLNTSWVPFSRYLFNTVFITVCGTFGNLILSSLCAYSLSKLPFPGHKFTFQVIQKSLMKRQAGPQHCSDNHFLPGQHHRNRIDRSPDRPGTIIERFTDFISHHTKKTKLTPRNKKCPFFFKYGNRKQ
mgnify:CR=1 FL=1